MNQNEQSLRERALSYLTQDEVYSIGSMLGREPNAFELNMFAAMWSEHISYKSSIKWLEEMPVQGEGVEIRAGEENAGVVRINDELSCVIKMESHNHPLQWIPGRGRGRGECEPGPDRHGSGARGAAEYPSFRGAQGEIHKGDGQCRRSCSGILFQQFWRSGGGRRDPVRSLL